MNINEANSVTIGYVRGLPDAREVVVLATLCNVDSIIDPSRFADTVRTVYKALRSRGGFDEPVQVWCRMDAEPVLDYVPEDFEVVEV